MGRDLLACVECLALGCMIASDELSRLRLSHVWASALAEWTSREESEKAATTNQRLATYALPLAGPPPGVRCAPIVAGGGGTGAGSENTLGIAAMMREIPDQIPTGHRTRYNNVPTTRDYRHATHHDFTAVIHADESANISEVPFQNAFHSCAYRSSCSHIFLRRTNKIIGKHFSF